MEVTKTKSEKFIKLNLTITYKKEAFFMSLLECFFIITKNYLKTLLLWYTVYYYSIKINYILFPFFCPNLRLIKYKKGFKKALFLRN